MKTIHHRGTEDTEKKLNLILLFAVSSVPLW